jgi:hypothetical protein
MPLPLPPKSEALRRTIARSHNLRLFVHLLVMIPFLAGLIFARNHAPTWLFVGIAILTFLVFIYGHIYLNRLDIRQSVAIGFVCPLCGAGLYCGNVTRLWDRGECPHCKQTIVDKLQ